MTCCPRLMPVAAALLLTMTAACAERRTPPRTQPEPPPPAAAPAPEPPPPPPPPLPPPPPPDTSVPRNPPSESEGRGEAGRSNIRRSVVGLASFYGAAFEGKRTASGRIFDKEEMVAAHPTYPFGTRVRVVNLDNDRSVVVRIIDRGPTDENVAEGVIIDLSQDAAKVLGFLVEGRQKVRVTVLEWGK